MLITKLKISTLSLSLHLLSHTLSKERFHFFFSLTETENSHTSSLIQKFRNSSYYEDTHHTAADFHQLHRKNESLNLYIFFIFLSFDTINFDRKN